ncbi:MAG: hypothetical protein KBD78_15100 [Oligoflexales bacterium]|nr:hypothetical protein [Oligoflexales bacterium]
MKIDLEKLKELAKNSSEVPLMHIKTTAVHKADSDFICAAANPQTILKLIELIEVYRYALTVHSHHGELLDSEAYKAMAKGLRILGE